MQKNLLSNLLTTTVLVIFMLAQNGGTVQSKKITRGKFIETIGTLHKMWSVSLELNPRSINNIQSSTNAFHASISNSSWEYYGDRTPSIFVLKGTTKLQFCGALYYPMPNNCYDPAPPLPMNVFTKIKIQQIPNGEKTAFKVFQNNVLVWNARPNYPTTFHNVKVYESDRLYVAADFEARNYEFHSGISKNHLVETIPKWRNMWSMRFVIQPYSVSNTDTNVLHATSDTSGTFSDVQALKIDFVGGTTKLRICYPPFDKSPTPYCITSPVELPLRKFTTVELQRRPGLFDSKLIVKVNGAQVFSIGDPLPKSSQNINVYMSNPVMTPASAIMEEYQFFTGLSRGHLIDEIHTLGPTYEFIIKVTPFSNTHNGYLNLLHATVGGDYSKYGDRVPAIYLSPKSTRIQVCSAVNGNPVFCAFSTPLPLNVASEIKVRQYLTNGVYYYQATVDGKALFQNPVQNTQPKEFKNVKVYASNPFLNADPDAAELNAYNYSDLKP